MMTRVSVHHQPDFKRDFVSFGVSNRSLGNLGRGEPEFIKTSADPTTPNGLGFTHNTAKSLKVTQPVIINKITLQNSNAFNYKFILDRFYKLV